MKGCRRHEGPKARSLKGMTSVQKFGLFFMLFLPFTALPAPQVRPSLDPHKLTPDELREWGDAVMRHQPGVADAAAVQIARWLPGQMYVLFNELRSLPAFRGNSHVAKGKPADNVSYPSPGLQPGEIAAILGLNPDEVTSGNINRLLHRAALLHTDIGQLVSHVVNLPMGSPFSGRITIATADGRQIGLSGASTQTEFASWLLDGVRPDPSADDQVRAWYSAVTAGAQRDRNTGEADWLLERARGLFPNDARFLFYSGVVHETMAMPRLQAAIQSAVMPTSFTVGGAPEQEELQRAAVFLSHALEVRPAFAEARLHLGRVNGLLGRHETAAADLTEAAARLTNSTQQYYAWLFLGREKDLLGDRDGARESFERAAAISPRAQSPLLAASELARRTGDSAGALAPLERLLAMPADESTRDDPWWWYDVSHVSDADQLLTTWRAFFRSAK